MAEKIPEKIPEYMKRPFRVVRSNSNDVVAGFDDLASAEADAKERNARAKALGVDSRYTAVKK